MSHLRKKITAVSLLFLTALATAAGDQIGGTVIKISDGDTIIISTGKEQLKIRLNGIDCPERSQAFGRKAKQFTANMVFRKKVKVITHGLDTYGRIIGDVHCKDGRSLNKELVKAGLAWWYRRYAPDNRELAALEASARKAGRGLWADKNPTAPWEFRWRERKKRR